MKDDINFIYNGILAKVKSNKFKSFTMPKEEWLEKINNKNTIGGNIMAANNETIFSSSKIRLKVGLILQSFSPVFLILLVKNFDIDLLVSCISGNHTQLGTCLSRIILILSSVIILKLSFILLLGLKSFQGHGFKSRGEKIKITKETTSDSLFFLITYILPLIINDITGIRDLLVLFVIIAIQFMLLYKTDLYYQNPVLAMLGYKTFMFEITNSNEKGDGKIENRSFIGITKGKLDCDRIIKRKEIDDNIWLVFNDN